MYVHVHVHVHACRGAASAHSCPLPRGRGRPARRRLGQQHAHTCCHAPPAAGLLRLSDKANTCLDDGGATQPGQAQRMRAAACSVDSAGQQWSLRATPGGTLIAALRKPGLCAEATGLSPARGNRLRLAACNETSAAQLFHTVPFFGAPPAAAPPAGSFSLSPVADPGLCADDGGSTCEKQAAGYARVSACSASSKNQLFAFDGGEGAGGGVRLWVLQTAPGCANARITAALLAAPRQLCVV